MIFVKRLPLKEIKELQNEILRQYSILSFGNFKLNNMTQCEIVKILIDYDVKGETLYQKDLEKILNIRKSTISGILETMEKNKIIIRVISNKGKIIKMSDEAREEKDVVFNLLRTIENELLFGINKEDLEVFFKVIDKMKNNIKKKGND